MTNLQELMDFIGSRYVFSEKSYPLLAEELGMTADDLAKAVPELMRSK